MRALIDADNLAFACAASAEDSDVGIAYARANDMVENILHHSGASSYELWLSGGKNFRYEVYPEYKANRLDAVRPRHEKAVKDFLTEHWQANWTDGIEADDMLGIQQTEDTILCHLDKDINQIAGWHYNWELSRLGKIIRERKKYYVTPEEADRYFFYQLLIGDNTDNIKGVVGIGPKKAESILSSTDRSGWGDVVRNCFSCEEELELNAACIYIWRKPNDSWKSMFQSPERSMCATKES